MSVVYKCLWCSDAATEFSLIHDSILNSYRVEKLCDTHNGLIRSYMGEDVLGTYDTYEEAELKMLKEKL